MSETTAAEREHNIVRWSHAGLDCLLIQGLRNGLREHWCGYVRVPEGHPGWLLCYDEDIWNDIEVHGGLTWSDAGEGNLRGRGWWLGFDCAHAGDTSEARLKLERELGFGSLLGEHVWTEQEARRETERLADQVAALSDATPGADAIQKGIRELRARADRWDEMGLSGQHLRQLADRIEAALADAAGGAR